jgi:hypothetical protein
MKEINDLTQGTAAWLAVRKGIPTASNFKRICTAAKAQYAAGADEYAADLLADTLGVYRSEAGGEDIERGHRLEDEARRWTRLQLGQPIRQVGFILSDCGRYGYSPDGILADGRPLEIKAPNVKTIIGWKLKGGLPPEHAPQVHGAMFVTGAPSAVFVAYSDHPAIENMLVEVERSEFTEKLGACVLQFCDRLDQIRREILGDEYEVYFPSVKGGGK